MGQFSDEEMQRLRDLLTHEGLDAFLPYAEQAAAEAKLSMAKRLVWRTYRQIFIAVTGLIIAIATFWEKATQGAGGFVRWLIGQ